MMKKVTGKKVMTLSLALALIGTGTGIGASLAKSPVAEAQHYTAGVVNTSSGHYITVGNNVKLYVEDVGEGKPVVFIHGWPANHEMYEYQETELPKQGIRFIGIDLRGFGKSDRPYDGYDMDTFADDVRQVIDKLALKDVTLAGFSMGGTVATNYMIRHKGHAVSKLMLFGAASPSWSQRDGYPYGITQKDIDNIVTNLKADRPNMLKSFGDDFFYKQPSPAFRAWFDQMGQSSDARATIESIQSVAAADLRAGLKTIGVPTLILHGVHDKAVPFAIAEQLHKGIRNSTLVPFQNSGHGLFYEEKAKFNEEIVKFVNP
ncbi:Pimeloyl-ACP methyl ester carboxylesterase [Paenibacillus sp. UNC496MF]|nr:Pimeloyl-ACP methyl ester carboxylesterase [Paenibacillus sp. UNC496MF]